MKPFAIAIVCLVLIAGVSGCKRSAAFDPGADGPAAYQITLKGTANPSTLFIPHNKPEVQSVITVRAIHNTGAPVVGREVYLTKDCDLGHFANLRDSVTRETDANGEVQVLFLVPAGTVLPATITMHIEARIHDDTRLDNPISEIYDFIPIMVKPAELDQTPIRLCGYVRQADGTGLENAVVVLTDSVTGWPIVTTTRPSGSWDANVSYGWLGTVTASLSGFTFQPASYTFGEANPAIASRCDLNFISSSDVSLVVDPDSIAAAATEGDYAIAVTSSYSGMPISYTATTEQDWITFLSGSDVGETPGVISITIEENTTTSSRPGFIVITPDSGGSMVIVSVEQAAPAAP